MDMIDARNNYLPPCCRVRKLGASGARAWAPIPAVKPAMRDFVPSVALLSDPHGEEIPARDTRIQLAWDEDALYLRARCREAALTLRPELSPDSPDFWRQDHIELRFLRDPNEPLQQTQFILAPDGRFWDNAGLWQEDTGGLVVKGKCSGKEWNVSLRLPFEMVDLPTPERGFVLRGIVAHTRWAGGWADIACISAVELGFSQAERYAEWVFDDGRPVALDGVQFAEPLLRRGRNGGTALLMNTTGRPVRGRLMVAREDGPEAAGDTFSCPCLLKPGRNALPVGFDLDRPLFRRFRLSFESDGAVQELGAVSLRGGVPPLEPRKPRLRHPYLYWTEDRLRLVRRKAKAPAFAGYVEELRRRIRELPVVPSAEEFGRLDKIEQLVALGGGVNRCLERWLLTGDARCARRATEFVRAAADIKLGRYSDLHEGGCAGTLAIAYDAFHPLLRGRERAAWVRMLSAFLRIHLNTARERHWNSTTIANANPVCNGGGGLVALALLREHPDAAEGLRLSRKLVRQYADYCYDSDGGCTEGTQYWQYGMENLIQFVWALEQALGTDDGLLRHPSVERCANMIRVALCNDGKLHGVNDTIPLPIAANVAMFLAGRFDDEFALWYADKADEVARDVVARGRGAPYRAPAAWALLFRPDRPVQTEQPPLPRAILLRDIQYAAIRSGTNYDCALDAGLKGSRPPYTHHNQPDTGSYYIDVRGERLMIDPGYYKQEPADHSLPIVNGAAPEVPVGYVGEIVRCESRGALRVLVCDSTPAYGGAARRVCRSLVMVGEEGLVLLDDIAGHRPHVPVVAQYQAGGATDDLGGARTAMVRGTRAALKLQLLTRPALALELKPERTFHDTHWGYHFAECRWFPMTGRYEADESDPLVTVFLDATNGDPGAARLDGCDGRLTVTMPSGAQVRFAFVEGRWDVDAERVQ